MPAFRDAVIHQVSSAGAEPPSAVPPPAVVAPHIVGVTLTPASAPPAFDITPPEIPRGPMLPETAGTIIQSLRMQFQQGGGDAVVHIRPEHLGPVSVSLRVENGSVSAVVKAENPAVAEWLQTHEDVLREGLASTGLHLERFAVRRDGQLPDDPRRNWKPPLPPERKRRMLQPQSTFEITV